jgi:pectinesterase
MGSIAVREKIRGLKNMMFARRQFLPFMLFAAGLTMFVCPRQLPAQSSAKRIIVDSKGNGDYRSIQAALNSLPDSSASPSTIFIRTGVYKEKVYIDKHNIIIEGEDKAGTIITQAIARDAWRCLHNDDWGVATVNLDGNDISFRNLTIINSYGFDWKADITMDCPLDTVTKKKVITRGGHQMAVRTMNSTRIKFINCNLKSFGGDTVSPWNVDNGLFYFKDCDMEGAVDFYCPRGWAYAENCRFRAHGGSAAIWHDGSRHESSKTVLKNCSFTGFDGFNLGRYHRDAQFYLVNCRFAKNMADRDIFLVPTTNTIRWNRRVYYYNCHREGGDYSWHKDNLITSAEKVKASEITANWTFGNKWKPEETVDR